MANKGMLVGVLGAGQMGSSAAVLFSRFGFDVLVWTRREEKWDSNRDQLATMHRFLDEHFGASQHPIGKVRFTLDLAEVDERSAAVLECIAEQMEEKQRLLERLSRCREEKKLVMTCTSGLSVTEMGSGSMLEASLVGAHFWNPPHLIPVVEVVAGKKTPIEQVQRACELLRTLDRIPIRTPDIPGFIGNRLMHAMWREAQSLVDAGHCTPEDVDQIVKWTFALRLPVIGPFENMDLVGHRLVEQVERYLFPDLATNQRPSPSLTEHIASKQSGMADGCGYYDWSHRDPAALIAARDRQILRQLQFLRQEKLLPVASSPASTAERQP